MKKNLAQNIALLILLTFLLKGIGFVNRIVIAYYFGTTVMTDIYYNASGFTDSVSAVILASLTVGVINIYLSNKGNKKTDRFISDLLIICICGLLAISTIVLLFADQISIMLAPAYTNQNREMLSHMLRVMCFTFPFQGAIAVYSAILQAEQRFTPLKLIGTITSVISIGCVILLTNYMGINSLVVAYIAGIIFNALFLAFNSRKLFNFSLRRVKINDDLRKLLILIGPIAIGIAAHEINLIVDKAVASGIEKGAISALSYSCVLYLFIENVIINSIVTAFLPNLTEKVLNKEENIIADNTKNVIFFAEILLIPIVIVSLFYSDTIIKYIYMRGSFGGSSLQLTKYALQGYILGLPFLALRDISMQVFYAYGDTKTPIKINTGIVVVNVILDFILSKYWGVFGITFATSFASMLSGVILLFKLKIYNKNILDSALIQFGISEIIVVVILCFVAWFTKCILGNIFGFIIASILLLLLQLLLLFKNELMKGNRDKVISRIKKNKES